MKAKSVLKPKSREEIDKIFQSSSRVEKEQLLLNLGETIEGMSDFQDWLTYVFNNDIWKKMAQSLLKDDKDEDTGRYISLYPEDRLELKRNPQRWFEFSWSADDINEAFIKELTDEELEFAIDKLLKTDRDKY